jgi:hypothetical protein
VGSRSKIDLAYIAGFLDGDGSLMLQLKKRSDTPRALRIMATVCFYQDTRHEKPLHWIRQTLNIGYVSRRNDGMSELRINGFKTVGNIIVELLPFLRFKKIQAQNMVKACKLLTEKTLRKLSLTDRKRITNYLLAIQNENYVTKQKKSRKDIEKILGLTP